MTIQVPHRIQALHIPYRRILAPYARLLEQSNIDILFDPSRYLLSFQEAVQLQKNGAQWITRVTGKMIHDDDLQQSLKSGETLCILINKLKSGSVRKIHSAKRKWHGFALLPQLHHHIPATNDKLAGL